MVQLMIKVAQIRREVEGRDQENTQQVKKIVFLLGVLAVLALIPLLTGPCSHP